MSFEDHDWNFDMTEPPLPKPPKFSRSMDAQGCIYDEKSICFNSCLKELLESAVGLECVKCRRQVMYTYYMRGTAFVAVWTCGQTSRGHTNGSWSSQPRLHRMYAGNLLLPACLVTSGNNYKKVALMCSFFNLKFVSEANFYR